MLFGLIQAFYGLFLITPKNPTHFLENAKRKTLPDTEKVFRCGFYINLGKVYDILFPKLVAEKIENSSSGCCPNLL